MNQEIIALSIVCFSVAIGAFQFFRKKGATPLSHHYLARGQIKRAFLLRKLAGRYWRFKS